MSLVLPTYWSQEQGVRKRNTNECNLKIKYLLKE